MLSYIERLRKAPLEERKRAAFFWTIIIVALVAFIWILSLGFRFDIFPENEGEVKRITPKEAGIESPY